MVLPKHAYFHGKIVDYSDAKVGVLTHALNYGTAVFGGMRAYWNDIEEQLFIFRPVEHFRRFLNSTKIIFIELEKTPEELTQLVIDLLQVDGYQQDIYIRPLVYKSDELIGVRLFDLHDELSIVAIPIKRYVENDTNAHVTISSWRRVDDNMIPARGKISGAYANSALIKTDAHFSGYDEALVLTQEGHISEGSAMNVFIVRNGSLITPPMTENILEGITRRTVIELAQEILHIPLIERPIDRTEAFLCDELFLTGTAAEVTAVTQVDHRPVGNGVMGPITSELRSLYHDAVRGRLPKFRHWNVPVYAVEKISATKPT